ncbi:unnamed protein product [Moneuplotes crassus]|uniref:Ribosome biogenesis regulatory protein n=1 Tax=Euplotes crassus TaxID=5936 RepID=A0AAD1XMC4_EUPCR|nr:unnamed protein product [Moneuplotes crassus]
MEVVKITNKSYDLGALVYHDSSSLENMTEKELLAKTKENANKFYQVMFDHRKLQPEKNVLEFDRPFYTIDLPPIEERIPRLVPPAAPKPETKWEKFRKEKGIAPRKRRDTKVYDPISKKWYRRFGHKSIKKLEEARTAIIEAKPGEEHINPFETRSLEKKIMLEKEKSKAIKNQMRAAGINMKLLREKKSLYDIETPKNKKSNPKDKKRDKKSKGKRADRQLIENTLKNAQISTASMGIYDKKATKNEKNVKRKKKLNKERSLKFLKILKKKDEIKNGVVNDDVLVRKRQVDRDNKRARARKAARD